MHIWNRPWPFIYEHHNRVPMLLSVTFDEIATLVWNFYWAHKFVAHWIRCSCVYFNLWPFRFVAILVCGRFGLWPFRFVAVSVCGRSGLWPFRFWPFRFVAVMTRILSYKPISNHQTHSQTCNEITTVRPTASLAPCIRVVEYDVAFSCKST